MEFKMTWSIYILTLLIYRVMTWSPSHIKGIIYCDDLVNETLNEHDQHYWQLTIIYDLNITFSTCESTFDTQIKVFDSYGIEVSSDYCDGDDCPDSTTMCSNNAINREYFTMPLNTGIYYIRISGFSTDDGLYVIQTTCSQFIENTKSIIISTNKPTINTQQNEANIYKMIELNTPLICNELMNSIDIIYNINYNSCVYNYCLNSSTCVMVNYVNNFKTETDSRCYLYDGPCDLKVIENSSIKDKNKIAIKGYKHNQCIDYPMDWMDSFGDNCNDYVIFGWCFHGEINNVSIDNFVEVKDNKYELTALDVCCSCGGGMYTFDNINIKYTYSIDLLSINDELCLWTEMQLHKPKWNVFNLYQLCIELMHKNDFNCDVLLVDNITYTQNVSIIQCDFNQFYSVNSNDTNVYFIILISLNNNSYQNTIYINSEWFDKISFDYISFTYEECMDELVDESLSELYMILPCDLSINDSNISFANTTQMYTTGTELMNDTSTPTDDGNTIVTTNNETGNTIQFVLKDTLALIFIVGFIILIGIVILFIIWFCKHTKKKDKQTKIEFSKLKTEVKDINRRNSIVSLSNQNINMLQNYEEEQKIAMVAAHNDEDDILHNNQCLLCVNNIANVVLWPCAHICYCNECASNAIGKDKLCPQCRRNITDFKQIFRGGFRV